MTLEEKVQAVLIVSGTVTALVSSSLIKVFDTDQQKLGRRYIVHGSGGSIPTHTHSGLADTQEFPVYQVECVAETTVGAEAIAAAVRSALGDYKSAEFRSLFDGKRPPEVDDDRRTVTVALDFNVWADITD